jgi:Zn-dependent protease
MFILSLLSDPIKTLGFILGLSIAITVHEFMHAYVADFLGDPTARYQGRLSLNPTKHLDPFGTLLLLLVGFGWGKPVPINPSNFKNPRLGELLTSLSGPLSNFIMAFIFALPLRFLPESSLISLLSIIIYINLMLCVFNLLPIPPLDGSKILWAIFPQIDIVAFEKIGVPILFGLVFLSYLTGYSIIGSIILPIVSFLARIIGAGSIF